VQLGEIAKAPTSLEKHLSPAEVQANIDKLKKVLKWAKSQPAFKGKSITPPEFFDFSDLVVHPHASPRANEYVLKTIVGDDEAAVKAAAAELDLKLPAPGDAPMNGHGLKPDHVHASVPVPSPDTPREGAHEHVPGHEHAAGNKRAPGLPNTRDCVKAITRAAGLLH
jgi:hypothetical protein